MSGNTEIFRKIYGSDPDKRRGGNRPTKGSVVEVSGTQITVDTGKILPSGQPIWMTLPAADGFTPIVGQTVAIVYPNNLLHGAYVAAVGSASSVAPQTGTHALDSHTGTLSNTKLANPNAAFCMSFHVAAVGNSALITAKLAATKNLSGKALTVLGVTVFAVGISGSSNPTVDVYEGASSILSSAQTVSAGATVYEASVSDASIANGAELSVRATTAADGTLTDLDVHVWVKAQHLT